MLVVKLALSGKLVMAASQYPLLSLNGTPYSGYMTATFAANHVRLDGRSLSLLDS